MKRKVELKITDEGVRGFFDRAKEHARRLDRKQPIAREVTITFENAADMMRVLSEERVRLLRFARRKEVGVAELAAGLDRDKRAVSRDVDMLESFGLLSTEYEVNPGHGRRRVVRPRATRYELVAVI